MHYGMLPNPSVRRTCNLQRVATKCTALHHAIMYYCTITYCIVMYCVVWYCIVLCCVVLCCVVLCCVVLCCVVVRIVLYCIVASVSNTDGLCLATKLLAEQGV